MKWLLIVLLFLAVGINAKQRYDDYQVLRVDISNQTMHGMFNTISEQWNLDVWAQNAFQGWADVMVTAPQAKIIQAMFSTRVHVSNVQQTIEESEVDMAQSRVPNDFFTWFPTYGEVLTWLDEKIAEHPGVATRIVLGKSGLGTDIVGLRIGQINTKPKIFIHCTIHAREWITTTSCCWIIESLLNDDPDRFQLREEFSWYIVPVLNTDGYAYTHTNTRLWRKNRAPNSGSSCIGTDLNRNYAYGWGGEGSSPEPCSDIYHGSSPFSSPETFAERNFITPFLTAGTLAAYVDIHAYGAMFMSPWGYTTALPPDYGVMETVMRSCTDAIYDVNGRTYAYGTSARVIYVAAGGSDDFSYGDGGVVRSFTIEAAGNSFTAPISSILPIGQELWAGVKRIAEDLL